MAYPKDITQLVGDLAQTPGVQRVLIRELSGDDLIIVKVWPSRFTPESPILLQEGQFLHIEGEWHLDHHEMGSDLSGFLNMLRVAAGLRPIRFYAEQTNGDYKPPPVNTWGGDAIVSPID